MSGSWWIEPSRNISFLPHRPRLCSSSGYGSDERAQCRFGPESAGCGVGGCRAAAALQLLAEELALAARLVAVLEGLAVVQETHHRRPEQDDNHHACADRADHEDGHH